MSLPSHTALHRTKHCALQKEAHTHSPGSGSIDSQPAVKGVLWPLGSAVGEMVKCSECDVQRAREQRETAQTRSTLQAQSTSCSHLLHFSHVHTKIKLHVLHTHPPTHPPPPPHPHPHPHTQCGLWLQHTTCACGGFLKGLH